MTDPARPGHAPGMNRPSAVAPSLLFGLLFLSLAGCQRVHVGTHDGGAEDAGERVRCGPVTCEQGQVCCNASCGICTAPGGTCVEIACTTECAGNAECAPDEYCALSHCPDGRRDGVCVPRPEACPEYYSPVCGCDGRTYDNPCFASGSGAVVAHAGACTGPCAPMDARGQGDCAAIVGIVWDGARCTYIGGCSCVGADCGATYATLHDCEVARAGCHSCAPQDFRGEGPCEAELGTYWDGTACRTISGCRCLGADCDNGWPDPMACQVAHQHCFGPPPGCTTSADCPMGEWCQTPRGACGGPGTCVPPAPPGWSCPDPGPPVCGCDGVTYGCDAMAISLGVNVASDGACNGSCAPQDASGEGLCDGFFGYAWTGMSCFGVSGCNCVGRDCGSLAMTEEECLARYAGCERAPGGECGGFAGFVCRPDEWCDYESGPGRPGCGAADDLGRCRPRPVDCTFLEDPVCGCDGRTHGNECMANAAGVDIGARGACPML